MAKFRLLTTTAVTLALVGAASANELRDEAKDIFAALPSTIPALKDNPITPAKIDLARLCSLIRG